MTLKRAILAVAAVFIALLVCAFLSVERPLRAIRLLQARYEKVQRGMSVEEVQRLMAHSPIEASAEWYPAWDDDKLPSSEAARIVSAFRYTVKTIFLPVIFEFTFDADRRLVGRHVYD